MNTKRKKSKLNPSVNRRTFLKVSGALASAAVAGPVFTKSKAAADPTDPAVITGENPPDAIETADDIIYSTCQMCHSRCGVRAKVKEGILVKIDGNPYHPNNRDVDEGNVADMPPDAPPDANRLPYNTPPGEAFRELGRMCLKGQSGIQTVYDPYRIQHPLKRKGDRNSGEWVTITWEQAFSEIAEKINTLIPPEERDQYINPAMPELGKKKNLLGFAPGRSVEKEMSERIWKNAWGTANYGLSHTSICEETRHVANELITWDPGGSKNSMGAGRTEGWQPDTLGAEYIIFFGANPLEADFPMVGMARNLMHFKRNGGKYVAVDPRFNNTAAQADQWVPITPGTDAALAMGMISWIIENGKYNADYLKRPHKDAPNPKGEPTWTDATYLVGTFTDDDGKQFQRYITAGEAGIANEPTVLNDDYVISSDESGDVLRGYNEVLTGDEVPHLDVTVTLDLTIDEAMIEVECKTAFTLLKDAADSMSLDQYASICGVPVGDKDTPGTMVGMASEFAGHGKKAVAITYRGPIQHTNGLYNQWAIQHLNTLKGNYDWKGGCTAGAGGWGHKSGVVSLSNVDGDPGHEGIRIDRAKTFYKPEPKEAGSLFTGYPAKRPWFPFATHGNYQEVIPSVQDQYPYGMKVLMTYWNAWPYSTPTLRKVWEETVADENKLPLLISFSALIGEVAAWADYVLPDTTYLEKFAVPGVPWRVNKGTSFQRPVVGAFDSQPIGVSPDDGGVGNTIPVDAPNVYTPALSDTKAVLDIHIGLAEALGLHGVGEDALLDGAGSPVGDLHNSWDWAKAQLENIVYNAESDHPGLTIEEVLSKGGVFDNPGDEYTDEQLTYQYENIIRTFSDPVARTIDSVTGEYWSGVAQYKPITHSDGTLVSDHDHPFKLITYKTVHHGQARTNVNPWLMLIIPENYVEISASDAAAMRVETGDRVKVTSASHKEGIVGKAKVTEGLKPGVVAISHHYGHWESHARPHVIDGETTTTPWPPWPEPPPEPIPNYDPSRGAGIQPTQIMRTDKQYPNVSLQDPIGGSCSFYDTWVKVKKL